MSGISWILINWLDFNPKYDKEQENKSDFWGASDIFEERQRFYQSVRDQKQVSAISSWASEIFEERQRYVYSQKTRPQKTLPLVCMNRIRVVSISIDIMQIHQNQEIHQSPV